MTTEIADTDEAPEEQLVCCAWCNDEVPISDAAEYSLNGRFSPPDYLCDLCGGEACSCEDCGCVVNENNVYDVNWHTVCEGCYDNYSYCDDHNTYYSDYCNDCDDEANSPSRVHSYSYKPAPLFYISGSTVVPVEPSGVSVTGFELEMEAVGCESYEGAELANSLFSGWTILKHDGSLSNGFEMVSHPMTHDYFVDVFPWRKVKELADIGMRSASTRTCGLHIHINKGFFSKNPTSLYRFMSMFYRNEEKWKILAGRQSSSYAVWSPSEADSMLQYTKSLKQITDNGYRGSSVYNYDRYVALNLQNSHTIELRFFKGTLRPETLAARVQAVHAVAQYSVETRNTVNIKSMHDWDRFREWTNQKKYNLFNTYADEKGL